MTEVSSCRDPVPPGTGHITRASRRTLWRGGQQEHLGPEVVEAPGVATGIDRFEVTGTTAAITTVPMGIVRPTERRPFQNEL